jgi:hypothetical protein
VNWLAINRQSQSSFDFDYESVWACKQRNSH